MWKLTGARVADLAGRAKGHLRTAYHSAVKWGGHVDNLMRAGRIAAQIAAPHISEGAQRGIQGGLSAARAEQVALRERPLARLVSSAEEVLHASGREAAHNLQQHAQHGRSGNVQEVQPDAGCCVPPASAAILQTVLRR